MHRVHVAISKKGKQEYGLCQQKLLEKQIDSRRIKIAYRLGFQSSTSASGHGLGTVGMGAADSSKSEIMKIIIPI